MSIEQINKFGGLESGQPNIWIKSDGQTYDPVKEIGLQTRDNCFAAQRFREVVKRPNFITPNLLGYVAKGLFIIEISTGTGMDSRLRYGITVVDRKDKKVVERLNKMFTKWSEVNDYIRNL